MSAEAKVCRFLDEYIADALNEELRERFETHLASCGSCKEEIEIEQHLDRLLSRVPEIAAIPPSLETGLTKSIRQKRKKDFYRHGLLVVAAVVLVGFFSILMTQNQNPNGNIEDDVTTVTTSPVEYKLYDPREAVAKIALKDPKKTLVVEYPTENKNITMVFLYPVEPQPTKPQKNERDDTSLE